jgi:hypothetical protein
MTSPRSFKPLRASKYMAAIINLYKKCLNRYVSHVICLFFSRSEFSCTGQMLFNCNFRGCMPTRSWRHISTRTRFTIMSLICCQSVSSWTRFQAAHSCVRCCLIECIRLVLHAAYWPRMHSDRNPCYQMEPFKRLCTDWKIATRRDSNAASLSHYAQCKGASNCHVACKRT